MEEDQKRLADALEELKEHNFMKIHESAWKFMYYNLLRGLAIGLGSVVGATVLVTIFIQILAQFEFIALPETKERLVKNTQELMDRKGFGSPTFFLEKEDMYFGNDRIQLIEKKL